MAYRSVIGFPAHSLVYSAFSLSRGCQWGFAMVVGFVAGTSSVAPWLLFPLCPFLLRPRVLGPMALLCLPFCSRRGRSSPLPRISAIFIGLVLGSLSLSHRPRTCCQRTIRSLTAFCSLLAFRVRLEHCFQAPQKR